MENNVLARVNGVEITQEHLEQTLMRYPQERQSYLNTDLGRKQLLEQIISFELMYNYGKEIGLDKDAQYLAQVEVMKKEILIQSAINNALSKIGISEEEITKYYNDNKDMFMDQESVRAKHILVETIEECEQIAKEISEGLSFEEAAERFSSCPSGANGGDLGAFTRGRMVPEFEKAAFELNIGEISGPVQTQFGYHLIKVEEKKSASVKPLEEVKNSVANTLLQEKQSSKYAELVEELTNKYTVERL